MNYGIIGINARGGGYNNEVAAASMIDVGGFANIIINEAKLCQLLIDKCPFPIYRMKDGGPNAGIKDDDAAFSKHDPIEFANAICTLAPDKAPVYLGNEFGSDNLARQDWWTAKAAERAAALGHRPCGHAQYMQHPINGIEGIKQYKSSVEMIMATDGAVLPHIYIYPDVETELKRLPRNSFDILDEWRQVYGSDLTIIVSEFSYANGYDPHAGPRGRIDMSRYADITEQAAEILKYYRAYMCVYGFFEPNTEWEPFNVREEHEYLKRLAKWNKEHPMAQWGPRVPAEVTNTFPGGSVMRSSMSATSGEVMRLGVGDRIAITLETNVGGSHNWYQVEKGGIVGYVAKTSFFSFKQLPAEPPSPISIAAIESAKAHLASARLSVQAAQDILKGVTPPSTSGGF